MKDLSKKSPCEEDRTLLTVGFIIIFMSLITIITSYIFLVNELEERNNKLIYKLNSTKSSYSLSISKVMANSVKKDNIINILNKERDGLVIKLNDTEKNASELSKKTLDLEDRFVHYYDEVQGLMKKIKSIKD